MGVNEHARTEMLWVEWTGRRASWNKEQKGCVKLESEDIKAMIPQYPVFRHPEDNTHYLISQTSLNTQLPKASAAIPVTARHSRKLKPIVPFFLEP